jgi:exopolyphosphatase / guanosine-5'-triphosphate,3'-diphosphate pyrophosphatase
MKKTRLAAIDIGTNSIRCIVVEAGQSGRFKVLDDEKATVRLGDQLGTSGAISPAAFGRAIEAVSRIRMLIDGFKVNVVEAVATSAVRVATNGPELVEAMSN